MNSKILKLPDVMAATALSRSSIYDLIKHGKFPAPIKLSERAVGWLASEVDGWLTQRAELRSVAGGASK